MKSRGSDFEEATQVKYRVARRKINTSFEGRNRIGVFFLLLERFPLATYVGLKLSAGSANTYSPDPSG